MTLASSSPTPDSFHSLREESSNNSGPNSLGLIPMPCRERRTTSALDRKAGLLGAFSLFDYTVWSTLIWVGPAQVRRMIPVSVSRNACSWPSTSVGFLLLTSQLGPSIGTRASISRGPLIRVHVQATTLGRGGCITPVVTCGPHSGLVWYSVPTFTPAGCLTLGRSNLKQSRPSDTMRRSNVNSPWL